MHDIELIAERDAAARKGEPYAIPSQFPVNWDTGCPLPVLIASDYRAYLMFEVREHDPWTHESAMATAQEAGYLCIVTLDDCLATKFGSPNEEVLHGHYLYGRGQEAYTAQIVVNSPWLKEQEAINRVHDRYRPERWRDLKHFILWFHDSTFECLASGLTPITTNDPIDKVLTNLIAKLLG